MGRTAKRGTIVLAALIAATATLATSSSASGGGGDPDGFSAQGLSPPTRWKRLPSRSPAGSPRPIRRCSAAPTRRRSTSSSSSTTTPPRATPATSTVCRDEPGVTGIDAHRRDRRPSSAYEDYTARHRRARSAPSWAQRDPVGDGRRSSLQRVYGGVAVTVPANQVGKLLDAARRGRRPGRRARADRRPTRAPTFIGAPTMWAQDRWPGPRRSGRDLRRPRQRRVAGAPVVRRQRPASAPAAEGRRHAARVRLRRQPADAGRRSCSCATTS